MKVWSYKLWIQDKDIHGAVSLCTFISEARLLALELGPQNLLVFVKSARSCTVLPTAFSPDRMIHTDIDHSKRHRWPGTKFLQLEKLSVGTIVPPSPTTRSEHHKKLTCPHYSSCRTESCRIWHCLNSAGSSQRAGDQLARSEGW